MNASSKSKYDGGLSLIDGDTHVVEDTEYSDQDESCRGMTSAYLGIQNSATCMS